MLDAAIATQLTTHFANLTRPVELVASLDDSPKSAEMWQLLVDLAELSDRITASRAPDSAQPTGLTLRRPSFEIRSAATTEGSVRFAGIPMGHEFTSLVLAVLHVGGHPSTAAAELLQRVAELPGEHHFETFFSLSCQNCPEVVQALNLMSVLNPRITHVAIDGAMFREEAEARQILAVPNVFRNGEPFGQSRMSLEQIVAELDTADPGRQAAEVEAISAREPFDVLVVGGGPAGASAAIYAARKGIATGLVAERFGGQVLDTMAIENFISVPTTEGPQMVTALEEHVKGYDVDLLHLQRAARLIPPAEAGSDHAGTDEAASGLITVELENGAALRARTVVLSTGARWRQLGVPGEAEYRNKGVTYCPHCDGPMFKNKQVAVVGGGNSGVEAAIDLAGVVAHVTLIEFDTQLRADAVLQRKLRSLPNVDVVCNALTTEILGEATMTGLVYEDRATATRHTLAVEGVFVQIGLLPNTEWLEGAVELSPRGEVVIDERGHTSVPGVFAAGDCTTVPFKQIVIAMGAGSTAALSAFDHLIRSTAPAEPELDEAAVA